ncbi:MAG: 23S rRNA (pseudouridine(1915)-N(3))-methyltransferase RlmH [Deltaproteobacteria bacterium]|nr:23S rRNA (pseudouridine(1915)-N(3))-methyltransferase RlmH [Deltaproteobacteria bacterium]MBW2118415.1 23S rRNA (pseudouridine(1915)-N(3))-methyltransferase RlmH [Deltaproteobacteria bacterium]
MLKIKIIVVDRTRSAFLKQGETFYLKRLERYAKTEWVEVKPASIKKGRPTFGILDAEGVSIAKNLVSRDYIIALDRSGKAYDSEELALHIEKLSLTHDRLTFVVGGPLGLSKTILDRSHEIFSLSRLTLTHEMSRLLLLEQLYRAFTIIKGEKYHK